LGKITGNSDRRDGDIGVSGIVEREGLSRTRGIQRLRAETQAAGRQIERLALCATESVSVDCRTPKNQV